MDPTGDASVTEAVLELPATTSAASLARSFVDDHAGHLRPEAVADARLLVSEIVANAVRHGRGAVLLRVRSSPAGIGIAVRDDGETMPAQATAMTHAETSGRGLQIVDALASAWGVVPAQPPPGKTVWFELTAGRGAPAPDG